MRRLAVLAGVFGLLAVPNLALAHNVHTVSGIEHGLGDGTDADFYVHPFVDAPDVQSMEVTLFRHGGGNNYKQKGNIDCRSCKHVHISYDTSPEDECRFVSGHFATQLNYNTHFHHYNCG